MGLNGNMLDAGQVECALYNGSALGPGGLGVASAQLEMLRDIGARFGEDEVGDLILPQVGVDERGVWLSCVDRVKDRR